MHGLGAVGARPRLTAENFGQAYSFSARAGQRVTIELLRHGGRAPAVALSCRDDTIGSVEGTQWSGTLPHDGKYDLDVFGSGESGDGPLLPYEIRLTIH
jgi:hypothetical protein